MNTVRLTTPAGTFAALTAGPANGPVALLLHGFPDTPFGYRPLMQLLATIGVRSVAPYMRGYHPSVLGGPFHADRLADDVIALADAVSGDKPVTVIGHDWGAIATYGALHRSPGRFTRAVTMAVPHPNALLRNLAEHPQQLRHSWYVGFFQLERADRAVAAENFELVERLWAQWSPNFRPPADYIDELKRCLESSLPAPLEYYRALFRPLVAAWRRNRRPLPIDTPTLNLHGADDGCIIPEMAARQGAFYRAPFECRVLNGVGHFLHIENPQLVFEQIRDLW